MSQLFADSFTRADAGTLGSDWAQVSSGNFGIVSNRAAWSGATGFMAAAHSTWTGPDDHYAECVCGVLASGMDFGPGVRMSGTSDTDVRGYLFTCNVTAAALSLGDSAFVINIYQFTGGVASAFATGADVTGQTISASTVMRLEVEGYNTNIVLRGYLDGVLKLTRTDTAINFGEPGMYLGGSGGATALDNFADGDLLSSVRPSFRIRTYRPGAFKPGIAR